MVININGKAYNPEDIIYFNTAYMVLGYYVIEIWFRTQDEPVVLEYSDENEYKSVIRKLKKRIEV